MTVRPRLTHWIILLSVVGVLLSGYSLLHKSGISDGAICNLSDTFNCDIVNQGPYSDLFGIPIALIGVVGYLFLAVAGVLKWRNPSDKEVGRFLLLASAGGFLFALYLSGIEAFVLRAWCLVCLASQGVITALLILSYREYRKS